MQVGWTSLEGQEESWQVPMSGSPAGSPVTLVAMSASLPPPPAFFPSYCSTPTSTPSSEQALRGIWVQRALPVLMREEKMDSFRNGPAGLGKGLSPWQGVNNCL